MMPITLYTKTDIGKERNTNEDSVASIVINSLSYNNDFSCGILVVADGMGGHEMGDVASNIASKVFIEVVIEGIFKASQLTSGFKYEEILKKAVEIANREVWKISKQRPRPIGTTLVGAIVLKNQIFIVNVGDSRGYLIQPTKSILQITKDHTAVQEMLDGGIITKEQSRNHPRKNVITRALGLTDNIKADFYNLEMNESILLLCSDGLHSMLDDSIIFKTMRKDIYKSADALISLANKKGGFDNISLAFAKFVD